MKRNIESPRHIWNEAGTDFTNAPPKRGFVRVMMDGCIEPVDVRKGYRVEKCTGEAHSNPWIDHCSLCAPMWGVIAVKED